MNINEVEEMWKIDAQIDPDNLHLESLKIPILHSKYYEIYNNISVLKKLEESRYAELQRDKWLYYSGKADPDVYKKTPFDHRILKADVERFLNADQEIMKSKAKLDYYQLMIKFLESILKNIENRNYTIRNSIEFMKFIGGYS